MKKILLLSCILSTTCSFGQKKLTAQTDIEYNAVGSPIDIDSIAFNYSSWQGSLNDFKPKLGFDGDIVGYFLREPIIHCDSEHEYYGNSYPLTLGDITTNVLVNGMKVESSYSSNYRNLYQYNSDGKLTKQTQEYSASGSWFVQDSTSISFDVYGNKTLETRYQVQPNTGPTNVDSMWYAPNSNNVVKSIYYNYDNSTSSLVPQSQSLLTYIGNKVQYIDIYESNGSGGLDWMYRLYYTYSGNQLTGFTAYDVANNVPTTSIFAETTYTFNTQNQPTTYTIILYGDTLELRWEYDTDGFVVKEIYAEPDMNNVLVDAFSLNYYWQNTAGIKEMIQLEVTLSPNPTSDLISINSEGKIESVSVFDMNGALLLAQKSSKIDISHLAPGNYFVKGNSNQGFFSKKIVKH